MGDALKTEIDIEDLGRNITHPTRGSRRHHRRVGLSAILSLVRIDVSIGRGAVSNIKRVGVILGALFAIGALIMLLPRARTPQDTTLAASRTVPKPPRPAVPIRQPLRPVIPPLPIVVDSGVRSMPLAAPSETSKASRRRSTPPVIVKHAQAKPRRQADVLNKTHRHHRSVPAALSTASPHLTGDALRRALAEDVIVTRRTNQRILANPKRR